MYKKPKTKVQYSKTWILPNWRFLTDKPYLWNRNRMKTPSMKKKTTHSKCFSYVLFISSNWVYSRLTELYFSGTEAAESKIITTSTEYGSVRKNIVYSKNYSHSLSHYYYLLYYKQCLFTKDISSIMSGLETKKNIRPNL